MLSLLFLVSCATDTTFKGEAHLTRPQCEMKCQGWDMDLDGMVAIGEYSDACVCKKKRLVQVPMVTPEAPKPDPTAIPKLPPETEEEQIENDAREGAEAAGPVGVILQDRRMQEMMATNNAAMMGGHMGGAMMSPMP